MPTTSIAASARTPVSEGTRSTVETASKPPLIDVVGRGHGIWCRGFPRSTGGRPGAVGFQVDQHFEMRVFSASSRSPATALQAIRPAKSLLMVMPEVAAMQAACWRWHRRWEPGPTLCRLPTAMRQVARSSRVSVPGRRSGRSLRFSGGGSVIREFRAVLACTARAAGDIGHRRHGRARKLLDKSAEDLEPGTADGIGDGVAEFLDPLGIDVLDRR